MWSLQLTIPSSPQGCSSSGQSSMTSMSSIVPSIKVEPSRPHQDQFVPCQWAAVWPIPNQTRLDLKGRELETSINLQCNNVK